MICAVGCNPADRAEKKAERFKKLDKNQDGKISSEEWFTPHKKKFKKLDTDKDGYISKDELKATKKSGSGRAFKKMDSDTDNKVTLDEWLSRGEKKFHRIDKNKDGFLAKDELINKTKK
jgi:Ca2+-binding EF-hand superfamily protein